MLHAARFTLGSGDEVLVELDEQTDGLSPAARGGRVVVDAKESFEAAFAQIRSAGASALATLTDMPRPPDDVELKFGIKLDAQAGAMIARTGVQAQFEVKLRWKRGTDGSMASTEPGPEPSGSGESAEH